MTGRAAGGPWMALEASDLGEPEGHTQRTQEPRKANSHGETSPGFNQVRSDLPRVQKTVEVDGQRPQRPGSEVLVWPAPQQDDDFGRAKAHAYGNRPDGVPRCAWPPDGVTADDANGYRRLLQGRLPALSRSRHLAAAVTVTALHAWRRTAATLSPGTPGCTRIDADGRGREPPPRTARKRQA